MRKREKTDAIVIHCSATPEGRNHSVADIRAWHKGRGFEDIGYHFVVDIHGKVESGRREDMEGAHCVEGGMNRRSIGVCYIGGMNREMTAAKDTRTPEQRSALSQLVERLCRKYSIPKSRVFGHRDFARKDCPSFDVRGGLLGLGILTVFLFGSCTRKVYVPLEHERLEMRMDTIREHGWRESIIENLDSVFVFQKGDTIIKETVRWRNRELVRRDTVEKGIRKEVSDNRYETMAEDAIRSVGGGNEKRGCNDKSEPGNMILEKLKNLLALIGAVRIGMWLWRIYRGR